MTTSTTGLRILVSLAAVLAGCAAAPEAPAARQCTVHDVPVRIGPDDPAIHDVQAELCARGRPNAETPVQVLLHGGTYTRAYWDWPYRRAELSYVEHAIAAGFATLNVDRLGYGASDCPDPERLDSAVHGYVVHQVVEALRDGAFGPRFATVVLNGHSMGGIAAEHAAGHGGVDAVIVSGIPAESGAEDDGPPDGELPFWPVELDPGVRGPRAASGGT